ncbi:hypothetical protein [Chryseobacterium jejuense]|uniref:hypothetical protein n=1 Tax=Chryseobacterium jejuense TaxID=445960 RepID=UPI001AE28C63|nr:hypothetical protein [Chryseobacterium jejuense]MBP2619719.1 hypothetical protein [Chryseobacterium jejuense]
MRKTTLITIVSIFFTAQLYSQENSIQRMPKDIIHCLNEFGTDLSGALNICESRYLDFYFEKQRNVFSFKGKKVYFLNGNSGSKRSDKRTYFDETKRILNVGSIPSHLMQQLLVFSEAESKQIGYDAAIITGSKKYITKEDIHKKIKQEIK